MPESIGSKKKQVQDSTLSIGVELFYKVYSNFRKAMQQYGDSTVEERDEMFGGLIMEQEKLEQRLMSSADDTIVFNGFFRDIAKFYEELKTLKNQFEAESLAFTKNMFKQINMISEQVRSIQDISNVDLKKICSDFNDLAKVTKLKEAYDQTLPEISRRSKRLVI